MKRFLAILMSVVLIIPILSGCGGDGEKQTLDEKTLIYGSGDYTSINPALYEHGEINSLIFLGLTAHDAQNNVTPAAAEQWTYDAETCTYTFKLRLGIVFHDGEPLTAEDVKFTIETIKDPANGSEIASNYEDIKSILAINDETVEIKLEAANYAMLDYLTVGILPKHLLEGKDISSAEFNQAPIGAGPYRLTDWDMGQSITLERFDDFYLDAPKIDKVIFKIIADSDVRALQLQSGEIDFAQITPKLLSKFESDDAYHVYIMDTADYRGIMYNMNSDFFGAHRELPNILSYAIDRQAILDSVLLKYGQVAYSPLQKGMYNNPDMEKFTYDPEKAKALLEAAGWQMGDDGYYAKDGEQLAFDLNNGQADQVRIDISNICAQNFQEIGVNAVVKINMQTDWAKQDAYLIGWGSPFDPDDHTYKVFGTDQGANYSGYSNSRVDEILTEARQHESYEERLSLYKDFQEELTKDIPYTFIAYIDAIYVGKAELTGITKNTVLGHHGVGIFRNVYEWDITK